MSVGTLHHQAWLAFRAVALREQCGTWVARRYAHKNGVLRLYTLACQLQAVQSL